VNLQRAWFAIALCALAHGTWRSADGVGIKDLGRLTQGAPADLLIFRQDSTKSLQDFTTLEAVVSRGKLCRQRDLLESLEAWRAFYENSVVDFVAQAVAKQKMKAPMKSDSFL
jgi:adenine deaminase